MDQSFFRFLDKKIRIKGKMEFSVIDVLFFLLITGLSLLIRYSVRNIESNDFIIYLDNWMDAVKEGGGISSIKYSIGNYSPLYMYLFTLCSYLPFENLGQVKILTLFFDYVAACVFFFIVYQHTKSAPKATVAYGLLLFLPSVLFNGAVWAQCDIIFTLFLVLCLERIIKGHPVVGCLAFGISFSFKLQAVFFFPVLLILWFKHLVKFKHFFLIPAVYLLSTLPAVFAGRNFWDVLLIYYQQAGTYVDGLTYNMPNLYTLVGDQYVAPFGKAGVLFAVAVFAFLLFYLYQKRLKFTINFELALKLSIFVTLLAPYVLPYMHERYAFPADIFALLLFCLDKKQIWLVICTQLISLFAYQPFLFRFSVEPFYLIAIFYLIVLCLIVKDIHKHHIISCDRMPHMKIQ